MILEALASRTLEAGRIIEEGDFRTLTAGGGAFARLVAAQNTGDGFLKG